eukprot:1574575-Pyramimonas_sp.AAC.1
MFPQPSLAEVRYVVFPSRSGLQLRVILSPQAFLTSLLHGPDVLDGAGIVEVLRVVVVSEDAVDPALIVAGALPGAVALTAGHGGVEDLILVLGCVLVEALH